MFCCPIFLPSELVAAYYVIEKVDLKREKVLNYVVFHIFNLCSSKWLIMP